MVAKNFYKYLILIFILSIGLPLTMVMGQNVFFGNVCGNNIDQIYVPPYTLASIITWSTPQANSIPIC